MKSIVCIVCTLMLRALVLMTWHVLRILHAMIFVILNVQCTVTHNSASFYANFIDRDRH